MSDSIYSMFDGNCGEVAPPLVSVSYHFIIRVLRPACNWASSWKVEILKVWKATVHFTMAVFA